MAAANPEEIRAMKDRLRARQAERRQEAEDAEVFSLFRRREAGIPAAVCGSARDGTGSGPKEKTVPLYGKVTAGVVVEAVVNGVIENWLFEMVLGLAVFAAAVL